MYTMHSYYLYIVYISLYKYNMYYLQCTYVYYDVICKNISLLSQSHYLSSQECRECKE